jgi:hypothetical protein
MTAIEVGVTYTYKIDDVGVMAIRASPRASRFNEPSLLCTYKVANNPLSSKHTNTL